MDSKRATGRFLPFRVDYSRVYFSSNRGDRYNYCNYREITTEYFQRKSAVGVRRFDEKLKEKNFSVPRLFGQSLRGNMAG